MIVNVPEKVVKLALANRGNLYTFERAGLTFHIKAHPNYKNRVVVDHLTAGEDMILRYTEKDKGEPIPVE